MSPRKLTYLLGPPAVAEASQRGRRRGQLPLVGRRPTTFTRYTYTARLSRAPFDRSSPSSFELHPETTPSRNDIDERTSSPRAEPLPLLCEARRRGIEAERAKYRRWGGGGERAIAEIRSAYGCSPTPRMLALSGPWGPEGEGDARRREAAGGFPGMRRDGRTNGRPSGEHGGIAPTISTSPSCINITLTPSFLRETCPNGRNCRGF